MSYSDVVNREFIVFANECLPVIDSCRSPGMDNIEKCPANARGRGGGGLGNANQLSIRKR